MGNCLSKYQLKLEIEGLQQRGRGGSTFQRGHKARLLGYYAVNKTTILKPVNDRFPAQAFDLEVSKFSGFRELKNCRNVSAIKMY